LSKNCRFSEHLQKFRAEFLKVFNRALFSASNRDSTNWNFTMTTSQGNRPRIVQLGLKLIF
jgi:hypothetical protein